MPYNTPPLPTPGKARRVVYFERDDIFRTLDSYTYGPTKTTLSKGFEAVTPVTKLTLPSGYNTQQGPIQTHGPTVLRPAFYIAPPQGTPEGWQHGVAIKYEPKTANIPDIFLNSSFGDTDYNKPATIYDVDENGYPLYTVSEAALNAVTPETANIAKPITTRSANLLFPVWIDLILPLQVGEDARARYDILKNMHPDWTTSQIAAEIDRYYRQTAQRPPAATPPPGVTQIGPLQYSGGGSYRDPGDDY